MSPERAYNFGITPDDVTITTVRYSYTSKWAIYFEDKRLTETWSVFEATNWVSRLRRLCDAHHT